MRSVPIIVTKDQTPHVELKVNKLFQLTNIQQPVYIHQHEIGSQSFISDTPYIIYRYMMYHKRHVYAYL